MSTYYREIGAVQQPFPENMDENNRVMITCHFDIVCRPTRELEEEMAALLVAATVGVVNTNIFIGPKRTIPNGDGPYLSITAEGGAAPERTHNVGDGAAYARPSVKVVVRGKSHAAAREMAYEAHDALDGVRNQTVTAV